MNKLYIKDFDKWNEVKKSINKEDQKIYIRAGEIRWIVFGVNVGSEIDGKGDSFCRPALIVNVSGSATALVIPMSSKIKDIAGYVMIEYHDKKVSLCIHQTKVISQKRILKRIAKITKNDLKKAKKHIRSFFDLDN